MVTRIWRNYIFFLSLPVSGSENTDTFWLEKQQQQAAAASSQWDSKQEKNGMERMKG